MWHIKIVLMLGWLLIEGSGQTAYGDGGMIRLSQCEGGYRISVFTEPTPFRAGPVDISVLIQDARTGALIPETRATIWLTPYSHPSQPMHRSATSKAATNKLLKAALFVLPEPGRWAVEVVIEGEQGNARVHFELDAVERIPQWSAMWSWIGWPAPVILLFSIHQMLVWRKRRGLAS
jgi:hypothetical protein